MAADGRATQTGAASPERSMYNDSMARDVTMETRPIGTTFVNSGRTLCRRHRRSRHVGGRRVGAL